MIGPVSGTGRAMMASLQQAMAKGMPPDQAIQYVKSMATQGVAPLADLYAMMNQFQRLKQQKAQAPQTPPTIKDQLEAMDRQGVDPSMLQAMPQGQQGQQATQMPQGRPQMEQGLGGLDAGSMERAQFAGGGIVAFAEGGFNVPEIYERAKPAGGQFDALALSRFSEEAGQEELARMYALALSKNDFDTASRLEPALRKKGLSQDYLNYIRKNTAVGLAGVKQGERESQVESVLRGPPAPVPAAPPAPAAPPPVAAPRRPSIMGGGAGTAEPKKEDITEAEYQKLRAFREREGLGAARGEMRQFLTDEEKRLEKTYGQDQRLAFAEMGFRMAQAASRPGATFLGALSEGAMSATQALKGINKELAENKRLLKQSMIKLKEAEELEKEGDYKAAMGLNKEARAEALKLYELRENLKIDREKIAATRESTEATRAATEFAQSESRDIQRRRLYREVLDSDPQYSTLAMQAVGIRDKDPEKYAQIRSQMVEIEKAAREEAGVSPIPQDIVYDPKRGLVDAKTGQPIR